MNKINKKASAFVYVLILINVALIIGYVVFNNISILNNNISIGKNAEEVAFILSDKGDINIESVKKYNSNGNGYADFISCPENITMSGTTNKEIGISSYMVFSSGSIYCSFMYTWTGSESEKEGRILFDENKNFSKVYYNGEIKDILNSGMIGAEYDIDKNNEINSFTIPYGLNQEEYSVDNIESSNYVSYGGSIEYELNTKQKLSKIVIKKKTQPFSYLYWDNGVLELYDDNHDLLETKTLVGMEGNLEEEILLGYSSYDDANEIKYIKIIGEDLKFLDIAELEIYKLDGAGVGNWEADNEFTPDNTLFSFDTTGVGGLDNIDDNMNSDNYRSTSTGSISYSGSYIDDDIEPRLTIFGGLQANSTDYFNIFWNNYKTDDMVDQNSYNDDDPDIFTKIGDVTNGYLFFDFFSSIDQINYDFKIVVFDKNKYQNEYTLLPIQIYETENILDDYGYLQLDGDVLSLSKYKTGNELVFDFENKDYAIFLKNNSIDNLAYKINGEENNGDKIYLNPIDDSKDGIIETIVNHLLIGGEKSFIGENLKIVGEK